MPNIGLNELDPSRKDAVMLRNNITLEAFRNIDIREDLPFDRCSLCLDNKYVRLTSSVDGGLLEWGFKLLIFNGPRNPEGASFLAPENVPEVHLSYHQGCWTGPVRSEFANWSEVGFDSDPNRDAPLWRAVLAMPDQGNLLAVHILIKEKQNKVSEHLFY